MFIINPDKSIFLTRGDIAAIELSAKTDKSTTHTFKSGDMVRLNVCEKSRLDELVIVKDIIVDAETPIVTINLESADTRIGDIIHRPRDYWYEVVLNPETRPQTLIGYDDDGPKIFRLFPEGGEQQ